MRDSTYSGIHPSPVYYTDFPHVSETYGHSQAFRDDVARCVYEQYITGLYSPQLSWQDADALYDTNIYAHDDFLLGLMQIIGTASIVDTSYRDALLRPSSTVECATGHTKWLDAHNAENAAHRQRCCHEIHAKGAPGSKAIIWTEAIDDIQRKLLATCAPCEDEVQYFVGHVPRSDAEIDAIIGDTDALIEYFLTIEPNADDNESAHNDIQRCLENRRTMVYLEIHEASVYKKEHSALLECIEKDCHIRKEMLITIVGQDTEVYDSEDWDENWQDKEELHDANVHRDDKQNVEEIEFYASHGYRLLPWRQNVKDGWDSKQINLYSKHLGGALFDLDAPLYCDMIF